MCIGVRAQTWAKPGTPASKNYFHVSQHITLGEKLLDGCRIPTKQQFSENSAALSSKIMSIKLIPYWLNIDYHLFDCIYY